MTNGSLARLLDHLSALHQNPPHHRPDRQESQAERHVGEFNGHRVVLFPWNESDCTDVAAISFGPMAPATKIVRAAPMQCLHRLKTIRPARFNILRSRRYKTVWATSDCDARAGFSGLTEFSHRGHRESHWTKLNSFSVSSVSSVAMLQPLRKLAFPRRAGGPAANGP